MRVGEVTVEPVTDGEMPVPTTLLYPDVPMDVWEDLEGTIDADGLLLIPFGCFLITDSAGRRIVFDLGIGHAPELPGGEVPLDRELLPVELEKRGCSVDSVTDVVISHLHMDHVGWASTHGVPTFPQARHHIHAQDWRYFVEQDEVVDEVVRRKVAPLQESKRLWEGDSDSPFDWLRLIHVPGHTPGASIALIESEGQRLALTGDLFHHPAALDHPEWQCGFDWEPASATRGRTTWLGRLRATRTPLIGAHFPGLQPITLA